MSLLKEILKLFKIHIKEHPEVKKTFTVNTPNTFKSIAIGQQGYTAIEITRTLPKLQL